MGVVTMVRMTRNMPRRLTDSTLYSSSMRGSDDMMKSRAPVYESQEAGVSREDYLIMMKRMNELEEKMSIVCQKPPTMAPEKEEMLNNAITRIDALEQELQEAKKVASFSSVFSFLTLRMPFHHILKFIAPASCCWTVSRAISHATRGAPRLHREEKEEEEVLRFLTPETVNIINNVIALVDMIPADPQQGVC